jgi:hypothetical protein
VRLSEDKSWRIAVLATPSSVRRQDGTDGTRLASYIPDPLDRGEAFELLLNNLAAIFCQGQDLIATVAENTTASRYLRCERKRAAIGRAAARDLDLVRANAAPVLNAAVHDQCRSGNRQLIDPLVAALGYRPVQGELIGYVDKGTDAEAIGATMAWYWARPPLVYLGTANWERGQPTADSKAAWDALTDLRTRYRHACLRAFLARDNPEARFAMSLGFTLDPGEYPPELTPDLKHARRIALADPDRFERLLHARAEQPSTTITLRPSVQM